jgi:hypothetical protein
MEMLDYEDQLAFLVLGGSQCQIANEKKMVLEAFGYVPADDCARKPLMRRDGQTPIFQVPISQELVFDHGYLPVRLDTQLYQFFFRSAFLDQVQIVTEPVQVLLGSHETNQGLTLLRVQHVHILRPIDRGWSQVVQATGRALRRNTHQGLERGMRCVATFVYRSEADSENLRKRQDEQKKELLELQAKIDQNFRNHEQVALLSWMLKP